MNRTKLAMLSAVMASGLVAGGCANHKDKEAAAASHASAQKYKILTGSTSDSQKETGKYTPEPALNVDTRFAAGRMAEAAGKLDCAVVQYDQALRLSPNHVPSLYRMGVMYTKMRKFDEAVAMWKRYIKATGEVANSYSNLAFCYEMAGDIENAEATYKEGLARDPNSAPCRTNYGLMLARQNRQVEAEVQLSAVLKPDEVSYNLAAIYEQQGAFAQAKQELQKAIAANPNNKDAQMKLANLSLTE